MKYRKLGSTNLNVSVIGLGTWQFGGEWGRDYSVSEVEEILRTAEEVGINILDTAECYGPDHLSESLIGQAMQKNRSKWVIATKFGHHFEKHNTRIPAWSKAQITNQLEASLRALRTDYIDLLQFHSGSDAEFFNTEMWALLQEQVKSGKVRHLGVSISSQGENLNQVETANQFGIESVQLVYNRIDLGPEVRVLPACQKLNLGVLARVPLASGYLSGKYSPGAQFAQNDVRASHEKEKASLRLRRAMEIKNSEVPKGVDMAEWALAWCLRNSWVTSVIPGSKTPLQVRQNAMAADYEFKN